MQDFSAFGVEGGDFVHDGLRGAVGYGFCAVGIFYGEIESCLIDRFGIDGPGFGGVGESLLELDEVG